MPSSRSSSSIGLPGLVRRELADVRLHDPFERSSRTRSRAPPRAGTSRARATSAPRVAAPSSARCTAASERCPSQSMKNRYSHGFPLIGRSWIDVRLTASRANGSISRNSAPGLVAADREHDRGEVAAAGRGRIPPDHEEARAVVAAVLDARRDHREPVDLGREQRPDRRARRDRRRRAARRRPCSPSPRARRPAAADRASARHCASGCGCEITRRTSSSRPLFESSAFDTRSTRSAHTVTSRSPNASSVWVTTPSVVFSTGTMPSCARPDSTAANTSEMLATPHEHRERAEVLARRLVRERALGPEIGDVDRLLERARGRDDLAEHRRDARGGERTGVPRAQRDRRSGARASARTPRCPRACFACPTCATSAARSFSCARIASSTASMRARNRSISICGRHPDRAAVDPIRHATWRKRANPLKNQGAEYSTAPGARKRARPDFRCHLGEVTARTTRRGLLLPRGSAATSRIQTPLGPQAAPAAMSIRAAAWAPV